VYPAASTSTALTAVAADDIWAVGYAGNTPNPYKTLIEHWDGSIELYRLAEKQALLVRQGAELASVVETAA